MKTNIKLFAIYLIIAVVILHLVTYYVTGHTPNDEDGRSGMVFAVLTVIVIIITSLNLTDKKTKEEILDAITCAIDRPVEKEEWEKDIE